MSKVNKVPLKKTINADKFRIPAIKFETDGYYTPAPYGTSEYIDYWTKEMKYCLEGYTAEDGDRIPGFFYFYLNYFPINLVKEKEIKQEDGSTKTVVSKERNFPRFYDYDRAFFTTVEMAQEQGKHLAVLKARRKGYSYKVAAMLVRNYYFIRESKGYALAAEAEYLTKDGILNKAWDGMDFIDEHTAWFKKRQFKNTVMHKRASYEIVYEGAKIETGYKSDIIGVTLKNDPQKARGKAGQLIIFEEAGKFPNLLQAWQISRPSVEQGTEVFGTLIAFGCVCKDSKVWNKEGNLINIQDIKKGTEIVGYDGKGAKVQHISYWQKPMKKECVRITTNTGRSIECSTDHPIYWSRKDFGSNIRVKTEVKGQYAGRRFEKKAMFIEANQIKEGDQIGVIKDVDIFQDNKMWEPRLVGWLIGDGSYGINKTPVLSNCEPEINTIVESRFDSVIEKSYVTKLGKEYRETRIKGITKELRKLGIYGQTKLAKTLPTDIHNYCKEDICEFLGGLFDTDGYVKQTDKRTEITLTSASKSLLLEVLLLLQKLGIHGNINRIKKSSKNPRDKNDHYRLVIAKKHSLLAFHDNINLLPKVKNDRLSNVPNMYKNASSCSSDKFDKAGVLFERVVSVENIGIQNIYNMRALPDANYIVNGIITHNTGGTMGADYEGLKELFERPDAYGCIAFENIWDDNFIGQTCGFFIPQYANMQGKENDKSSKYYGKKFMDKDGNTIVEVAKARILEDRRKVVEGASDKRAIDRHIAELPITPAEATLNISSNIFPKKDLSNHRAKIHNDKRYSDYKQVGDLILDNSGKILWQQAERPKDLVKYRLDPSDNPSGQIVIWEHPPADEIPWGMYIAGCDPYDHDKSGTNSLGSIFIYKRQQELEGHSRQIVAEYTGRPNTADEFYENCRRLLLYFRATLLYENEKKGIFTYFRNKNCEYLLADQPDELIRDIVSDSKVQRGKGIHMTTHIKENMEVVIRDWLIEKRDDKLYGLHTILSEPLLEELEYYNDEGNFDRVIAFGLVLLYEKHLYKVRVKNKKDAAKKMLFEEPLFDNVAFNNFESHGSLFNM